MTDAPPIITNEDAAIDSAFFGSHAGRTCYVRAHHSGWVLVVRQIVAQREPLPSSLMASLRPLRPVRNCEVSQLTTVPANELCEPPGPGDGISYSPFSAC
jgi:hypothetical protein